MMSSEPWSTINVILTMAVVIREMRGREGFPGLTAAIISALEIRLGTSKHNYIWGCSRLTHHPVSC